MPRNGIDYSDVATACEHIIATNQSPTVDNVREILKTGSRTTISKYLKLWRERQGINAKLEHELPESLLITVKGLHQAMTAEANTKLEQLEINHAEALKTLQTALASLQQQHNKTLQTNRELEQDKTQLIEEKAALERHIEAQKHVNSQQAQELHLLTERLNDKKADIDNLHQQLQHAQTNLEHYCEATRQEREQERLTFDEKLIWLEQSLRDAQNQTMTSKAEIAHFKQNNTEVKSDLAAQIEVSTQAQNQVHALELKSQQQASNHNQLQKEFDTIKQHQCDLVPQAETDRTTIQELMLQTERDREKVSGLEKALAKSEETVTTLTDKNLSLVQEKVELTTTLAQLETTE